jgi:hypothetical protein
MSSLLTDRMYISTGDCWIDPPPLELSDAFGCASRGVVSDDSLCRDPFILGPEVVLSGRFELALPFGSSFRFISCLPSLSRVPSSTPLGSVVMLAGDDCSCPLSEPSEFDVELTVVSSKLALDS